MFKQATLILIAMLLFSYVNAQTPTDSAAKKDSIIKDSLVKLSPIKTLSYTKYQALVKGGDLYNMAAAGELNHYPLPGNVLRFKKQLDLSPVQIGKITAVNTYLQRKKPEMGAVIIRNELVIDSLFRTSNLDDGTIIFYTNRYGLYQCELRNAILQACFATEKPLSPGQIKQLEILENHK